MGFFDEDDDDEEEEKSQQQTTLSLDFGINTASGPDSGVPEEEEDPLDAYMKSIQSCGVEPSNNKHEIVENSGPCNDEHQLEDEDEWQMSSKRSSSVAKMQEATVNCETEMETEKNAISMTFRKGKTEGYDEEDSTRQPARCRQELPPPPDSTMQKTIHVFGDTNLGRTWRREASVTLSSLNKSQPEWTIDPVLAFEQLTNILPASAVSQLMSDYPSPTTVQSQTFSVALAGRDALVTAATGQGKTLSFIVAALCHMTCQTTSQDPNVLILVPTRELALQVEKQSKKLVGCCGHTLKSIVGGHGKWKLMQDLKRTNGVQIVVATPGRLLDVVSSKGGLSLDQVSFVVLDEADKMLAMGFDVQVRRILEQVRSDRQTLMLSATMGKKVQQLTHDWLQRDAIRIAVGKTGESSRNVNQQVMVLPDENAKVAFLVEMVPVFESIGRSIIFVASREGCEKLAETLRERTGVQVLTLHADKHQSDRAGAVKSFRKGDISLLVATDIASRGLDIPNVQTVISFDPAKNLDSHVHRVGRAGRLSKDAGENQAGSAYTLLTNRNANFASVLRSAFEREGREVTPELSALANRKQTIGSRGKSGLGFHGDGGDSFATGAGGVSLPPRKRSRWG